MSLEYDKKGHGSKTKKLLDKVQYSVKEKYGFIPTSIAKLKNDNDLVQFLKDLYVVNDEALIDNYTDVVSDLIFESLDRMEKKYGRVPKSIDNLSIPDDYREFIDDTSLLKRVIDNGGVARARGGGFTSTYNYSTFNPSLAEFLLKLYFEPGYTLCDPFAGRVTRALMANKNKIHYHGWDVSEMTLKVNENKLAELEEDMHPFYDSNYDIKYFLGDGTKLEGVEDNTYDGIFTCPPYFNIEKCDSVEGQLTDHKKYNDFLDHYGRVFERMYSVVKPTTSIQEFHPLVIVTGNIRIDKKLVDFTRHTRNLAEQAGFELYDEIHHENNSPFVYLGSRRNEARKMVAKVHETVSIFFKRGEGIKNI